MKLLRDNEVRLRPIVLCMLCMLTMGCASVHPASTWFVHDKGVVHVPVADGVRVTYLGVNGYLFESSEARVLVDPFFSRNPLLKVMFGRRIEAHLGRIEDGLRHIPEQVDLILVTHGHYDHLMDAPEIAKRTGARILASPTSCYLAQALGTPVERTVRSRPGDIVEVKGATVHVLAARHDRLFCRVPYPGKLDAQPDAPKKVRHWKLGIALAFVVEIGGQRIYVDSGGHKKYMPDQDLTPIDLAIMGVALKDSRGRVVPMLHTLQPRYFLPSHQDNFFTPIEDGFELGPMTDFKYVQKLIRKHKPPSEMILLNYFEPWTLK